MEAMTSVSSTLLAILFLIGLPGLLGGTAGAFVAHKFRNHPKEHIITPLTMFIVSFGALAIVLALVL